MKRIIRIIGYVMLLAGCLVLYEGCRVRKGDVFEIYEMDCKAGRLRVVASHELSFLLDAFGVPGGFYDFEFKRHQDRQWETLHTLQLDDPVTIPKNQIRILENDVAIAYMDDFFMSSPDGGLTWTQYEAVRNEKLIGFFTAPHTIQDVLTDKKPWIMKIRRYGNKPAILRYHSDDFGATWEKHGVESVN